MVIQYPIFITGKDDPRIEMLSNDKDLGKYDDIDIEDSVFFGWTADGLPFELYLDKKKIKVRLLSTEPQLNKLKESILNYVKLARPKSTFIYSGPEDNVIELFKAAEKHIQEGKVSFKLKRFIKGQK